MTEPEPVIMLPPHDRVGPQPFAITAEGKTLVIADVAGGGEPGSDSVDPAGGARVREVSPLHVHYEDDEAWHVISGTLRFRFQDRTLVAEAGATVLVPAGVAHTFGGDGRYLLITTPRLNQLISELHAVDRAEHAAVFKKYDSELLE
jgi:hypothetical protein